MASKPHTAVGRCWCGLDHDPTDQDVDLIDLPGLDLIDPPREEKPGFDVFVKQSIGRVTVGRGKMKSPLHAALDLIADWARSDLKDGEYSFTFPPDMMANGEVKLTVSLKVDET